MYSPNYASHSFCIGAAITAIAMGLPTKPLAGGQTLLI